MNSQVMGVGSSIGLVPADQGMEYALIHPSKPYLFTEQKSLSILHAKLTTITLMRTEKSSLMIKKARTRLKLLLNQERIKKCLSLKPFPVSASTQFT